MTKSKLQIYIEKNIPIIKEMGFSIEGIVGSKVSVRGSYCKHINHTNSVFGGSISSVMTLTAWASVRTLIDDFDSDGTVVIKNNFTNFIKPVIKDYRVTTKKIEKKDIDKLIKSYNKFGKGRIIIEALLTHIDSSEILAEFRGEYVILKDK